MSWESDSAAPGKDRAKLIWAGVAGMLAVMVVALWFVTGNKAYTSRVHAKHILVAFNAADPADRSRALETVNGLRKRILDGESFAKLARDYSNDVHSAKRGGDLGWLSKGELADAVENYVWAAPINQISDALQTGFGFHLVVVIGRKVSDADQYEQDLRRRAFDEAGDAEEGDGTKPSSP